MKYLMSKEATKKLKSRLNVSFMNKRNQNSRKISKGKSLRREGDKKGK